MERLTDRKTAVDLKTNYEGLQAVGMPRDIDTERYIKLAEYENREEEKPILVYVCDINKNLKCKKTGCFINGGECRLTQYKEYAMTDENGNAIVKEGDQMKLIKMPVSKKAEIRLFADMVLKQVLDDTTIDDIPIRKWIEKIMSNEYREVKHGKWVKGKCEDEWFCTVCHNDADLDWKENPILSDYCPKCGAEMKEGD